MTLQEVCEAIEAETHTRMWAASNLEMRLDVIAGCISQWETGEPEHAAKKVVKQRKTRKPKTVPLTQHAGLGAGLEGNE